MPICLPWLALFVVFLIIWYAPLGNYFGILVKPAPVIATILGLVVVWFFILRTVWRARLFERFLDIAGDGVAALDRTDKAAEADRHDCCHARYQSGLVRYQSFGGRWGVLVSIPGRARDTIAK